MAKIEDGKATSGQGATDPTKSQRVCVVSRANKNYTVAGNTGTIAAALAANSSIFAMRLDPGAINTHVFIDRIAIQLTTIVAFTVPVTAGRILGLYRGTGAAASGGTALAPVGKLSTTTSASEVLAANGGDVRIATTGALTVTGITYETTPLGQFSMTNIGTAGASAIWNVETASTDSSPIILTPGQVLAIRNPTIFDAAGTWQASIVVSWHEASLLDATVDA